MSEEVKKKKKGKSLSAQIKALRASLKYEENRNDRLWRINSKIEDELRLFRKILQKKYYSVEYTILANDKITTVTEKEIVCGYSAENAIEAVKKNKTYPDSFELIDIMMRA